MERTNKNYYPLMLDLQDKPCVIVGGGAVAERKAESLLEAGARVTVISPACTAKLQAWSQAGKVDMITEPYCADMQQLRSAVLVFAATDQPHVNAQVRLEAEALGKLVNVANDAEGSGFIVPAAVRRGKLLVAVSTAGASPTVARKVKRQLERTFGEEYEPYLDLLQKLRQTIQRRVADMALRQQIFKQMLEWELLAAIRAGRFGPAAEQELLRQVELEPTMEGMECIRLWIAGLADSDRDSALNVT